MASGKFVIIGIVTVALVAAATSLWVRYNTTHRAAKFWGSQAARLIRDAPKVTLFRMPSADTIRLAKDNAARACFDHSAYDISQARGLVHLRNALLDDRSFIWPSPAEKWPTFTVDGAYWLLSFYDPKSGQSAIVMFSQDCRQATGQKPRFMAYELTTVSTQPIAAGLVEMFAEQTANSSAASRPTAR
jgi:hypothetical protein